jgi:hypothetical protein
MQSYTLHYTDGAQAGHGYDSASIKLNYRFLLCADEIQVAYGIDRRSLSHSERYVVRPSDGGNFAYATPAAEPQAPSAVKLNLRITRRDQSAIATIGHLRDAAAGETLGMGCVTAQTATVGTAKVLVGPQPTRAQIKTFLDTLILANYSGTGTAPDIDMPLTNAEFPVPPPVRKAIVVPRHKKG